MLNGLDLFSGYGGIARALSPWVRTITYCEIEKYCQGILLSEMQRGRIDRAPIWDNVRTLRAKDLWSKIDIITGGFPCQDVSLAGSKNGAAGSRTGLYQHVIRLIGILRPQFVFLENVPGLLTNGLERVLNDLARESYVGEIGVLSASQMGAWHQRRRVWILAYPRDNRYWDKIEPQCKPWSKRPPGVRENGPKKFMAMGDLSSERLEGWGESEKAWPSLTVSKCSNLRTWPQGIPQPTIQRNDDGFTYWKHRTIATGNGVVPCQAREAFKKLMGLI